MPLNHYGEDAPRSLSDVVLVELDMKWCREPGVMAPLAAPAQMGAVLGLDGAGRYVPYMTDADDEAVAVLISKNVPAGAEEQPCTVLRRGACVAVSNLQWLDSVTEDQKKTALGQLAALGIVPKE